MINSCVIGLFSFILAMAFHDFHTLQISVTCFLNILFFSVCYCHVTYLFHSEYLLYSCLNVKELFTRNRRDIWSLSNNNGTGWLNGWVFVYELSGFGFESRYCHLHFFLVLLLYLSTKINKQLAGRLLHFILRN